MWSGAPAKRDPDFMLSVAPQIAANRLKGQRIGLLGGSFNPAHAAHRHISLEALKRLDLDYVWWLVSPQNPLKHQKDTAPYARRVAQAKAIANHPRIKVLDLEQRLGSRYTIDTLRALNRLYPDTKFVWLMGADNLIDIPRWHGWREIFARAPIAILDRPHYSIRAPLGKAAQTFRAFRIPVYGAKRLADKTPPAWTFLRIPRHSLSATELRARGAGWIIDG